MTREEAIKRLKEYAPYSYGIWHDDEEDTKAFDMAIEALKADAVSREMYDDVVQTIIKREKQFTNMVSVVRCKDCDNFDYDFNYCNFLDAGVDGEDFFCAYGERREP